MVEVVVSAMLVVLIAMGAFGAIDAATRSTAEERHRAQAHALAEQDQARLRSLQVSTLSNRQETRAVTVDGSVYTVTSRGDFISADATTTTCGGDPSADYIRITSRVTWPSIGSRPPVVVQSIVAPPNGSIATDRGALAIVVLDAEGNGVPDVTVQGSGAGMFSGTTGSDGCALFGNLPEGNYTLTASGVASNLVDRDGNPPGSSTTSVVGGSTNTVTLQYAEPGAANISFSMRRDNNQVVSATARSVMAFNTGMTQAKAFSAQGGNPAATISAAPLFPFASPISFYAGKCTDNNPNPTGSATAPGAAGLITRTVPPGGTVSGTVQIPALHVTAVATLWGTTHPLDGARVTVTDQTCPGDQLMFDGNADSAGRLFNVGLPWGRYDVCVSHSGYRRRVTGIDVKNMTSTGTRQTIDLAFGGVQGSCP